MQYQIVDWANNTTITVTGDDPETALLSHPDLSGQYFRTDIDRGPIGLSCMGYGISLIHTDHVSAAFDTYVRDIQWEQPELKQANTRYCSLRRKFILNGLNYTLNFSVRQELRKIKFTLGVHVTDEWNQSHYTQGAYTAYSPSTESVNEALCKFLRRKAVTNFLKEFEGRLLESLRVAGIAQGRQQRLRNTLAEIFGDNNYRIEESSEGWVSFRCFRPYVRGGACYEGENIEINIDGLSSISVQKAKDLVSLLNSPEKA